MAYQYRKELPSGGEKKENNNGVYFQTLFGQCIGENPVPVWTAEKERNPFLIFKDPETGNRIGISKEILSCGFLTIAEPGGGKTNLLNMITEKLLETQEENDKIIIFDTKGDYYREFGNRIPKEDCILIGAGNEYRDITWYHNIFAEIMPRGDDGRLVYTEDCKYAAMEKSKQLFRRMQSETQPIFPAMARLTVAGILVYFMRTYWRTAPEKLNNQDFIAFIAGRTNEELKAVFEQDYMKDYRICLQNLAGKSNMTQSVTSYVGTTLLELFMGPFAEHDPQKEFSMREIVESKGKKAVFVEYDLKLGEALEPMYGLLMDSALSNALGGRETARNKVYFILDEMLLLPQLDHLSNALNFGRSQGVRILCGLQNTSGLTDIYEEAGAKRVLASFQNLVAFRNSDRDTRLFLMDRLGENYRSISYSPQQENISFQRAGHTVEDWDLLSLRFGEAVVSLRGENPFYFTMPEYQKRGGSHV